MAIASTQPLASQDVVLNPCPDAPGAQIPLHVAREQGNVLIDGVGIGRVVEDAGRAADVEDGPTVAARGHVVGEEAGQGEDRVQGGAQRRCVILQNTPGGVGIVMTKVGVAYHHVDRELVLDDDDFVQLFGGGRSRRQVGGVRRHIDLVLMLISQLGGKFLERLPAPSDEDEVVPQGGMVVREGQTRTGGRTDDEHDLPSLDAIVARISAKRRRRLRWWDDGGNVRWAEIVVHARRVRAEKSEGVQSIRASVWFAGLYFMGGGWA